MQRYDFYRFEECVGEVFKTSGYSVDREVPIQHGKILVDLIATKENVRYYVEVKCSSKIEMAIQQVNLMAEMDNAIPVVVTAYEVDEVKRENYSKLYPKVEIVDICNLLYMINGRPQAGKMYTEKFGTYQCTLAVREMFMQKTHREINDAIIEEVLITGTANIGTADLKIIRLIATEYVKDIFRRLREHGYDEGTMTLYIIGGGGCLVKNFYKVNNDRVRFVDDICAAAKGYEYMAEIQLKSGVVI